MPRNLTTQQHLTVRPHFPFSLLFLPELFGLELNVPLSKIKRAERKRGLFGQTLRLHIDRGSGRRIEFELRMRNPDGLIKALQAAGVACD